MRYRNNYENLEVAILQIILLSLLAPEFRKEVIRWKAEVIRIDNQASARFGILEREWKNLMKY